MLNKLKQTSDYYFLACMTFVLGLFMQDFFKLPLTGGIIILGLSWIFTFNYRDKLQTLLSKPAALLFIAIYLLHLISIVYTDNKLEGWNDMRLKITLFLLPLFILSTQLFSYTRKIKLLKFFALLMVVMAGIDLGLATSEYMDSSNIDVFYYTQLPSLLVAKPHYTAWYYSFAMFVIIHQILTEKTYRLFWGLGFLLLLISLVLLSSRIFIIAFVIVFITSFVFWAVKTKASINSWLRVFFGFLALIIVMFVNPKIKSRISDTKVEIQKLLGADTHRETNPRVYLWQYGLKIVADKPILGYGVGDAKKELNKALKDCDAKFWNGEKNIPIHVKNFNFHNQFLQTWAEVGILGFVLLVVLMFRPFLLKNQHPLFLIFVGLTLIGFLTESMLERQAGVVLFAFMYPLLSSLKVQSTPE
jgi:O-antigen ligase